MVSDQSKGIVQILQKVLDHIEVSLTGSKMAALLFVGWLCTEECTGNRGGSLWLSQAIPGSFTFCPLLSSFILHFQVALALI